MIVGKSETNCMFAHYHTRVVLSLFIVLEGRLRRQQVRADVLKLSIDAHQYRFSRWIKSGRCAGCFVRIDDEVIEIEIAESAGVGPAALRVIDSGNVAVRVIEIGKGRQADSAESCDSY